MTGRFASDALGSAMLLYMPNASKIEDDKLSTSSANRCLFSFFFMILLSGRGAGFDVKPPRSKIGPTK
jgi:hypothetical protein